MIFSGYNSTVPIPLAPILIIFSVLFIAQFVVKRDKRHQKFEQFERQYGPVAEAGPEGDGLRQNGLKNPGSDSQRRAL